MSVEGGRDDKIRNLESEISDYKMDAGIKMLRIENMEKEVVQLRNKRDEAEKEIAILTEKLEECEKYRKDAYKRGFEAGGINQRGFYHGS